MASTRTFQRSFSGGELSTAMFSRLNDPKFVSGVARARNMIVTPQGNAFRRPGTELVRELKDSSKRGKMLPFTYSTTETYAISAEEGAFRFYTDGGVLLYATSRIISSVNTTAETITFTLPHDFAVDDPVRFLVQAGSTLPGGVTDLLTYYIKTVPSTTTATISATMGGATLNLTAGFAGTVAVVDAADVPAEYIPSETVTGSAAADTLTFATAHAYANTNPITLTVTGGALPTPLEEGVRYYIRDLSGSGAGATCTLAATSGGSVLLLGTNGTGTISLHYAYDAGDLVHTTAAGVYNVNVDNPSGDSDNYHLLPITGEFEVWNPYVESNLFYLNYDQRGDTMRIAHPDHELGKLTRVGLLDWTFTQDTSYGAPIDTPVISSITRTFGEYWAISMPTGSSTATTSGAHHTLGPGEAVYLERTIGVGDDFTTGGAGDADVMLVDLAPTDLTMTFRTVAGGTFGNSTGSTLNGYVRRTSLSAIVSEEYVVTALTDDGSETVASASSVASFNPLYVSGSFNTINWSAITGAARYRVYKKQAGGLYGLIGESATTSFVDDNKEADTGITPPEQDDSLDSANPGVVSHFEQRQVFSGVESLLQEMWLAATGTDSSLIFHLPVIDTDRISLTLDAPEVCSVRHIVPLDNLLVFTSSAEFVVTPVNTDAITPTSYRARAMTYIGASTVKPLNVNRTVLFGARGGHIYSFSRTADVGYEAVDLSIRAAHLFDNKTIIDSALSKAPYSIAWYVSSNGYLLGCTFLPDQDIGGWHWHDTAGTFESCCVVAEGDEDALYVIVARTVDGQTKRYVERMASITALQASTWVTDVSMLDSSLSYSGVSTSTFTGLEHLEDNVVTTAFRSGTVQYDLVESGSITTDFGSTYARVGLGYTAELKSLPVVFQIDQAFGQGRTKNINKLWLQVETSAQFEAGPSETEMSLSTDIEVGSLLSGNVDVHLPSDWTDTGQVWVRQSNPWPLNVISLCAEVSIGS